MRKYGYMHAHAHARVSVFVYLYIPASIIHSLCQPMLTDNVLFFSIFILTLPGEQLFLKIRV